VLSYTAAESATNSVSSCLSTCASAGYVFGGVEFGKQCFCGSSLAAAAKTATSSNCNYACSSGGTSPGDFLIETERKCLHVISVGICGGFNYINIYNAVAGLATTATVVTTTATATSSSASPSATWTHLGCYPDASTARVLSYTAPDSATNSVSSCTSKCTALGYVYSGVEFGVGFIRHFSVRG
jgi:hypothetical protein